MLEKIEFTKEGLLIDNKKYGMGITKIEIESIYRINVYVSPNYKSLDELTKEKGYCNPEDLTKYKNIKLIIDE